MRPKSTKPKATAERVVVSSGLVFAGGSLVIYLGRAAYGSRKRVY